MPGDTWRGRQKHEIQVVVKEDGRGATLHLFVFRRQCISAAAALSSCLQVQLRHPSVDGRVVFRRDLLVLHICSKRSTPRSIMTA